MNAPIIRGLLVVMLGMGASVRAQAQSQPAASLHFERLDGLSHNTVFTVLQDQQGFLWIGTADGLNRYDGYDVRAYRHLPADSTSLVNNIVQALAEAPHGDLWVGTASGLDRLDRTTGRFVHYDLTPDSSDAAKSIARVVVDGAGRLWISTYGDARLYRFNPASGTFERYGLGAPSGTAGTIEVGPEGRIWAIGSAAFTSPAPDALYRYDAARDDFEPVTLLRGGPLHTGPSGTMWIGGPQSDSLDVAGAPAQRIRASIPWGAARNELHEGRDGTLWIGTGRGLYRFDPSTGALQHHLIDTTGTAGLSNYVWALHEDRAGILWVGTRSGLYRYDPHRKPFAHWGPDEDVLRAAGQSAVMALREAEDGALWVGTLGGGLVRLRREGSRYRPTGTEYTLPSDHVWVLHEDRRGQIWVGTAAGSCVLDPPGPRCAPDAQGADPDPVYTIAEGPDGALWRGGTALHRRDPLSGWEHVPLPIEYGTDFSTIQALHAGPSGHLWIGMEGGGLARYDVATGTLTEHPHAASDRERNGLSQTVWTIHENASEVLWLGTDTGLVRLDPSTGSVAHYFDADRLPGSIVYSILEDERGRLWLGTNQGLVRFDPDRETFRHYDASDGLRNTEFNRRAALRGTQGRFFFGGLRGITAFDPAAIRDNPYVPPVVITQMTKVSRSESVVLNPSGRTHVVLDYRDRVFTFTFAALNFTHPEKNQYAYRLDGFEDGWVEAGTRRTVRYTNVPPGEYVFRVKGANNDGVWNEEGASIRVTITPPFWQTGWFRVLMGALLVGAVVLAYRLRVRHLLAMERLRLRIASDLHDDVASQLASVAISSDVLRATADLTEDEHAELREMGRLVRVTTETLRDIVWFVDPEHDQPEALLWKMKNEASALLSGMAYTFEHPEPERLAALEQLDVRTRRNLFLIYKEALHNIVRHARAETVQITLRPQTDRFELTITDDGIGFDPEAEDAAGQGLSNMRRRAEQMQADLTLASQPAHGTTLRLVVPIT